MNLPTQQPTIKKSSTVAKYRKKGIATPDMTPMVDLGFLLIAFFVMTTELSKPSSLSLVMPKDGPPMPLGESNALTLLLGEKNIYYYFGKFDDAVKSKRVLETSFSEQYGIGSVIRKRQQQILDQAKALQETEPLMLLIKPTVKANYNSVIKSLDEALINDVKRYMILKPDGAETSLIKTLP